TDANSDMASSPLHAAAHHLLTAPRDTVADFMCGCGVSGCYGCVDGSHTDYKDQSDGRGDQWYLATPGGGVGEGGASTADATTHNSASFYSASSESSSSPVDQPIPIPPYAQLQYAQATSLPQIDSLMTSDAEPMFFDRMNEMKFVGDVKMEPGLLAHPQSIDIFQHSDLMTYHGMTPYQFHSPLDYLGQQPHLIFDPNPQPSAQPTALLPAHLSYEQPYAPSPSTAPSVNSAFSLPPSSLHQQPPSCSSSYSPPPQDPLVASSIHARTVQKKRIQAVSCHSNSICANCGTRDTSLWRRNTTGEIECNACNLYFRKNGRKRPMSLKKGVIMKRNRKPRTNSESN
ncbi:elt-3, partial [Pristionchus pacificus]